MDRQTYARTRSTRSTRSSHALATVSLRRPSTRADARGGARCPATFIERRCDGVSEASRHATRAAVGADPGLGPGPNSAGGFVWAVDDWTRLRRFLVLGSEGGSYYAREWKLTRENAQAVERCIAADGPRTVAGSCASAAGPGAEERPGALRARDGGGRGDVATRKAALDALPRVVPHGDAPVPVRAVRRGLPRLGPLAAACGRPLVPAKAVDALAYQAVKYRQREGMTHRDVLRLAHPARRVSAGNPTLDVSPEHARLFEWIVRGGTTDGLPRSGGFRASPVGGDAARGGRAIASTGCRARRCRASTSPRPRCGRRCSTTCR